LNHATQNLVEAGVSQGSQLIVCKQLNWMRHEHHSQIGHPERSRLFERFVDERLGADAGRREAATLQSNQAVHTARHAGSSVS